MVFVYLFTFAEGFNNDDSSWTRVSDVYIWGSS